VESEENDEDEEKKTPIKSRGKRAVKTQDSDSEEEKPTNGKKEESEEDEKLGVSKREASLSEDEKSTVRMKKREEQSQDEDTKADLKEEETKAAEEEEYSDVVDGPIPKKRKKKEKIPKPSTSTSKPKKATSSNVTDTPDDAEIKKLQSQLVKCGIRKIWAFELKSYGDDSRAKIRHLRDMLRDAGMDGRFSETKAREIKERRELQADLEAVTEMNSHWGAGRASRSRGAKPSKAQLKEVSHDDEDVDAQKEEKDAKHGDEDEESEDGKVYSKARGVSRAQADLAFLGDESESD
jgi:hypothetical protein